MHIQNHSPTATGGLPATIPRIGHHVVSRSTRLAECLTRHFRLSDSRVHELLTLGAVYLGKRRQYEDCALREGNYVRVHLMPKRFDVGGIVWQDRIVAETQEFLLVDKPPGVPTHATLDNAQDNVLHQLRQVVKTELWVTQRLDVPVGGLLFLAKTRKTQARFNSLLLNRQVEKSYQAVAKGEPTLGKHTHFMEPSDRAPKKLSADPRDGWVPCELEFKAVRPMPDGLFEIDIQLGTGRTHQIRAQLSFLKCPIVGDRLYGSTEPSEHRGAIRLYCVGLAWEGHRYTCLPPWRIPGSTPPLGRYVPT